MQITRIGRDKIRKTWELGVGRGMALSSANRVSYEIATLRCSFPSDGGRRVTVVAATKLPRFADVLPPDTKLRHFSRRGW